MEPTPEALRMFGSVPEAEPLPWSWVDEQLTEAATYWVVAPAHGHPHPRPVWGVWVDGTVQVSMGSPVLRKQLTTAAPVTVHLDSGVDVVIVEGLVSEMSPDDTAAGLEAYNAKYDWNYAIEEYGPLTKVVPVVVKAWRAAGRAGRDGFKEVGRWRFS